MSEIKLIDKKIVIVFLSVSIIIFLSITVAKPNFYFTNISGNYFEAVYYWLIADGLLMLIVPFLIIKFIFKEKLSSYGFAVGDKKFGLITTSIFLSVMIIVVWFASASKQFAATYPQGGPKLKDDMVLFILFELCVGLYMLGWEFLWRGYMLFGLKEKFGYYAIFIQMIPFFILHKGKPEIELFASIFAGIILGFQALRARSFIYCWLLHWGVMISIDTLSVIRSKTNFYGILPF